jgi:hypothetical protein
MVTENTTSSKRETRTINHAASGLEMANMLVLPYCILAGVRDWPVAILDVANQFGPLAHVL